MKLTQRLGNLELDPERRKERSFTYRKLHTDQKEIRLLILEPSRSATDQICCKLRHATLSDKRSPFYETISYVWGDASIRATILVHGRPLSVPASADRALRRFREPKRYRVLWIDAVCINQTDQLERSQQVAMMADIYSKTAHGLIWLGEDEGYADQARVAADAVVQDARSETHGLHNLFPIFYRDDGASRNSWNGLAAEIDLTPLLKIYGNSWFRRLWVVQESALPRESHVYCGNLGMSLGTLLMAAQWLRYKYQRMAFREDDHPGWVNAAMMWEYADRAHGVLSTGWTWTVNLLDLLSKFSEMETQEPRDHIYGLLGLYESMSGMQITANLAPDYEKPVAEVYRDATMAIIEERQDLAVLECVELHTAHSEPLDEQHLFENLPSWVPRWAVAFDNNQHPASLGFRACADGTTSLEVRPIFTKTISVLAVKGVCVDRVKKVSRILAQSLFLRARSLMETIDMLEAMLPSDQGRVGTKFALTLAAGVKAGGGRWSSSGAAKCLASLSRFLQMQHEVPRSLAQLVGIGLYANDDEHKERLAAESYDAMWNACRNRRFFVTHDGRLGLGPQTMELSDVVAVLYGFYFPVIVRPLPETGHCTFVGVAYVHGIMNGEAVRQHEEHGKEDEWFYLH